MRLTRRPGPLRCAYCHGDVKQGESACECGGSHSDCMLESDGCVACGAPSPRSEPPAPRVPTPGELHEKVAAPAYVPPPWRKETGFERHSRDRHDALSLLMDGGMRAWFVEPTEAQALLFMALVGALVSIILPWIM